MTFQEIIALIGAVALLLTAAGGIFAYLGEKRKASASRDSTDIETDEARAARIDKRQVDELARLGQKADTLEIKLGLLDEQFRVFREQSDANLRDAKIEASKLSEKLGRVQAIIRRHFAELRAWQKNPVGSMPMPSPQDMRELEIEIARSEK